MANEDQSETPISNWTLATGTAPGQRQLPSPAAPIPFRRRAEALADRAPVEVDR